MRALFGNLPGREPIEAIALRGSGQLSATILSYGAAIQSVIAPDREGRQADVTLGYPTLDGYLAGSEYFGATVGRVANRIARGRFALDGRTYQTPINNGDNALHGGARGFDKVAWEVVEVGAARVALRHVSPDGDQGYPGTLTVTATYAIDGDVLAVDYEATADRPTVVNISNHAYWNLAGEGSADGAMAHRLTIPADHFTPVDAGLIPTGALRAVAGTVFDFREPTPIGARVRDASDQQIAHGRGYDHNWAVARAASDDVRLLARLAEPHFGRVLEIHSNQPGLQFYAGNFLDGTVAGKAGRLYRQGDGIALEPQMFPDTPNRPEFGSVRLDPGQTYRNRIEWRFATLER